MDNLARIPERDLWVAVVLQAREDILDGRPGGAAFDEAVAFFTSPVGEWARARLVVADHLALHPDDLRRVGERALAYLAGPGKDKVSVRRMAAYASWATRNGAPGGIGGTGEPQVSVHGNEFSDRPGIRLADRLRHTG